MSESISGLSYQYTVRSLTTEDLDLIYSLCLGNPLYYHHCPPAASRDGILEDIAALPPGKTEKDKFYIGFFQADRLIAVMDLVFHYPNPQTAYIGFFMMAQSEQGQGTGSRIIQECFSFLRKQGYDFVRLGIVKGNPQSEHFWKKNGFSETGLEVTREQYTLLEMEKSLK